MRQENRTHWLMRDQEVCRQLAVAQSTLQAMRHHLVAVLTPSSLYLYVRDYVDAFRDWLEGTPATPALAKEFADTREGLSRATLARGRLADEASRMAKGNGLPTGAILGLFGMNFGELNYFTKAAKLEAPRKAVGGEGAQFYSVNDIVQACRIQGPGGK